MLVFLRGVLFETEVAFYENGFKIHKKKTVDNIK
jgi:hypothetical protein